MSDRLPPYEHRIISVDTYATWPWHRCTIAEARQRLDHKQAQHPGMTLTIETRKATP